MTKRLRPSFTFTEERLAELRAVVPEAFADGRVNWEALKEALCEWTELEGSDAEHFGLFWPGKREARRLAAKPSRGTLVPVPGEGVNEETTRNLFIEGDNLEVLKLLQKSYAGRVKMIYIDPPYNTGNDFVYKDDFRDPLRDYLRKTGQVDEEGEPLTTNTRADGRFHSNWLSMMYPRLRLARTLLRDDGLLFVSIDDNEVHNLRQILDEIMGPENFIANIAWEKRFTRSNNARLFYSLKDSILLYRRSDVVTALREQRTDKANSIYKNPDKDPRGPWTSSSYVNPATKSDRPNLVYALVNPVTGRKIEHPTHAWKYSRTEHERHVRENRLWWGKDGSAKFPRLKVFLSEGDGGLVPIDLWDHKSTGTTDEGGSELKSLMGAAVFDNPKPTRLIQRMLRLCTNGTDADIILDFFAGSGSTAHAVLSLNHEDGGNRRFIAVQLPEPTPPDSTARAEGFNTLADVAKERIRRVGKKLSSNAREEGESDLGFRVLALESSHFKVWEDYNGEDIEQLEAMFQGADAPLVKDWTPFGLLTEVLIVQGFPLDARVESLLGQRKNEVYLVSSDDVDHRLWICLDRKIQDATLSALTPSPEDVIVCLDSALSDEAKLRLADRCTLETI